MGHFHTTVIGRGKTKDEAQSDAVSNFFFEEGHRHDLREVESAMLVRKEPPMVWRKVHNAGYGGEVMDQVADIDAPQSQWVEVWEFVLHTHA